MSFFLILFLYFVIIWGVFFLTNLSKCAEIYIDILQREEKKGEKKITQTDKVIY